MNLSFDIKYNDFPISRTRFSKYNESFLSVHFISTIIPRRILPHTSHLTSSNHQQQQPHRTHQHPSGILKTQAARQSSPGHPLFAMFSHPVARFIIYLPSKTRRHAERATHTHTGRIRVGVRSGQNDGNSIKLSSLISATNAVAAAAGYNAHRSPASDVARARASEADRHGQTPSRSIYFAVSLTLHDAPGGGPRHRYI